MAKPTVIDGPWGELVEAYGGVGQLAKACGVDRNRITRWYHGAEPAALVQRAINAMARRRNIAPPFPKQVEK